MFQYVLQLSLAEARRPVRAEAWLKRAGQACDGQFALGKPLAAREVPSKVETPSQPFSGNSCRQ